MPVKDFAKDRQRMRELCLNASDLIDELSKMFPPTMPDLSLSDRELGAHVGQRKLVELLAMFRAEAKAQDGPLGRVLHS